MKTLAQSERGFQASSSPEGDTSFARGSSLLPSITHVPEKISQDKQPEKPKRSNFTQLPNCVIDSDLPDTTIMGFIRFVRHCSRAGVFTGSLRKLCKLLGMARMTVARMIAQWAQAGWIIKTSRPKADEEGESMCLILLEERLWEQNSERYKRPEEAQKSGLNLGHLVPNVDRTVPELDQGVPNTSSTVPNVDRTVPPPSTKVEGKMGSNTGFNTTLNTGREYRGATDSLPALPPSSVLSFSFEELTSESPHRWEALHAIGAHYLGAGKATQSDAEALLKKTHSLAQLAGPHEVRRQLIVNITFMLYSTHKLNWFKDKKNQVSLRNVATYWDDYVAKAEKAQWLPPTDKAPTWFYVEAAAPEESAAPDAPLGMSRIEAESLADQIAAQYPGMKLCYGHLPGDLWTVALWLGEEQWLDLYAQAEWRAREQLQPHWSWVMETYQQQHVREEVA